MWRIRPGRRAPTASARARYRGVRRTRRPWPRHIRLSRGGAGQIRPRRRSARRSGTGTVAGRSGRAPRPVRSVPSSSRPFASFRVPDSDDPPRSRSRHRGMSAALARRLGDQPLGPGKISMYPSVPCADFRRHDLGSCTRVWRLTMRYAALVGLARPGGGAHHRAVRGVDGGGRGTRFVRAASFVRDHVLRAADGRVAGARSVVESGSHDL